MHFRSMKPLFYLLRSGKIRLHLTLHFKRPLQEELSGADGSGGTYQQYRHYWKSQSDTKILKLIETNKPVDRIAEGKKSKKK